MSRQDRYRQFECQHCGALPGEFCVTEDGRKAYTSHVSRIEQETAAWFAERQESSSRPGAVGSLRHNLGEDI